MDLAGKILIAMPALGDPRFARSVILLCAHSDEGAMGLVVNHPAEATPFATLLETLGIPRGSDARDIRVHLGGPVERGRGFVLHSDDWTCGEGSMVVPGGLRMTATLEVLEALASGGGPARAMLALGYSGWGPGQLEGEIRRNDWLVADPRDEVIFALPDAQKWSSALRGLGIDPLTLSPMAGRA